MKTQYKTNKKYLKETIILFMVLTMLQKNSN